MKFYANNLTFQAKKAFVDEIDSALFNYLVKKNTEGYRETIGGCASVRYEVYVVPMPDGEHYLREYVIMQYLGGAIAPRNVTGNSLALIMKEIGGLTCGGYYDEVEEYKQYVERAIRLV